MSRKRLKNWLIFRFLQLLAFWLARLPRGAALKFCSFLGLLSFWVMGKARRMTVQNLSRAFGWPRKHPRLARTACQVFVNAGKNLADLVHMGRLNGANIDQLIKVKGRDHIDRAMARGCGVIAITGHIGNWELLAAWFAIKGYPVNVVFRRVYDPRLDQILNDLRKKTSVRGISRNQGVKEMIRVLRRGETLGVLMDQDTKVRGVFVPFFGRAAYTPVGPVVLAQKTGATIVPMAIHRQKDETHLITIERPVELVCTGDPESDTLANTAACTAILEHFVRIHPEQWVWMHDRWKRKSGVEKKTTSEEIFHAP
jgi:KDO2-lipid IV(A) lauroyltransferase